MLEQLAVTLFEKATNVAFEALSDQLKRKPLLNGTKLLVAAQTTRGALQHHLASVQAWSHSVKFRDLLSSKSIATVYVELETYAIPLSRHMSATERSSSAPLMDLLARSPKHAVLLGPPGAGKTTSLQKICNDYFSTGKVLLNYRFPLVIRLRELRPNRPTRGLGLIYEELSDILKIAFELPPNASPEDYVSAQAQVIEQYVDCLRPVIVIDGFDELPNEQSREGVLADLRALCRNLKKSKVVVTCRSKEFPYELDQADTLEIRPLTPAQIELFAAKWLPDMDQNVVFMQKVAASPFFDTAMRPLTLAHLCAIYERTGDIPDKPKTVYRKIVQLLLEDWDQQRSVKRSTKYANFSADRKLEFLGHLAYFLSSEYNAIQFTTAQIVVAYSVAAPEFGLPKGDAKGVAAEIESHSGLILEAGHDSYEFAHRSLQEFLAADYLVRLPSVDAIVHGIGKMPAELAIATALSSKPTDFFAELVLRWLRRNHVPEPTRFYQAFVQRLEVERPDLYPVPHSVLAAIVVESIAGEDGVRGTIVEALTTRTEEVSLLGRYVVDTTSPHGATLRLVASDTRRLFPTLLSLSTDAFRKYSDRFGV
jgi:NACHT domain